MVGRGWDAAQERCGPEPEAGPSKCAQLLIMSGGGGKEEEEERWKGPGGVNQSIVQFIRGVVQELPNTIMRLKVCATT